MMYGPINIRLTACFVLFHVVQTSVTDCISTMIMLIQIWQPASRISTNKENAVVFKLKFQILKLFMTEKLVFLTDKF